MRRAIRTFHTASGDGGDNRCRVRSGWSPVRFRGWFLGAAEIFYGRPLPSPADEGRCLGGDPDNGLHPGEIAASRPTDGALLSRLA